MSEDTTKEMEPVLAAIAAMRQEFNQRFEAIEVRLERLEARTLPLQGTLVQILERLTGLEAETAKIAKQLSRYKEHTWETMGEHEGRIRKLEESRP